MIRTVTVLSLVATALAGCATGMTTADEACAARRSPVAAYADCLRANEASLRGGWLQGRDLGPALLAAAEFAAAEVAAGRATEAEAQAFIAQSRVQLAQVEATRRSNAAMAAAAMMAATPPVPAPVPRQQLLPTRPAMVNTTCRPSGARAVSCTSW